MTRTQSQFPDPLYQRLKEIAEQQDWSLSEIMRKAPGHFITRFPDFEGFGVDQVWNRIT